MAFEIVKELSGGKVLLDSWPLCEVLFVNDALYPGWLVLVPRRTNAREIFDLTVAEQIVLIQEISKASRAVQAAFNPDKLNIGALGNVVAQLHIHVVPRFAHDKSWPGPVWGAHPNEPFKAEDLRLTLERIEAALRQLQIEA